MAQGKYTVYKLLGVDLNIQFADDGAKQLSVKLDHFGKVAKDFSPIFQEFNDTIMMPGIQRNFSAQGRPTRWANLAEATVKARIRNGYGAGPILVASGGMKNSFRARIGKRSYAVYNLKKWFKWNNFGTPTIPARTMVVLLVGQRRRFTEIARKHLGIGE